MTELYKKVSEILKAHELDQWQYLTDEELTGTIKRLIRNLKSVTNN